MSAAFRDAIDKYGPVRIEMRRLRSENVDFIGIDEFYQKGRYIFLYRRIYEYMGTTDWIFDIRPLRNIVCVQKRYVRVKFKPRGSISRRVDYHACRVAWVFE